MAGSGGAASLGNGGMTVRCSENSLDVWESSVGAGTPAWRSESPEVNAARASIAAMMTIEVHELDMTTEGSKGRARTR
jgi:hypothetical protein